MELKSFVFFDDDCSANCPLPKFRYVPLHDLESLWWIGAHFLIARAVTHGDPNATDGSRYEDNELDQTYYVKHRDLAIEMFGPEAMRSDVMTVGFHFFRRLNRLHPAVRTAGEMLQDSRRQLVRTYKTVEKDLTKMTFHSADGMHEMLRDCFAAIADKFKDADFYMEPVPYK